MGLEDVQRRAAGVQPGHGLQELADRIVGSRQDKGATPYTLVIGELCAREAGVPSMDKLREAWGEEIDDPAALDAVLWSLKVPPFYYDIANLARAGCFPVVVTTWYDRLLERALVDLGLRQGDQFQVVDAADRSGTADPPAELRIVSAYGLQGRGAGGDDAVASLDAATGHSRSRPLPVVVVGYLGESEGLARWLGAARGGDLWWANPEDEAGSHLAETGWRGEVAHITGAEAVPETFFGQLALVLLRIPGIDTLASSAPTEERSDDWYNRQYTQSRLHQATAVKQAIESGVSVSSNVSVGQNQLAFQGQVIGQLEQDLVSQAAAEALLKRYLSTQGELQGRADRDPATVDPDTFDFLASQIGILGREAAKAQPNRVVVSAAEASLRALQDTLGIGRGRSETAS